jgi:hypothetical protein
MLTVAAVLFLAANPLDEDPSRGRLGLNVSGGAAFSSAATAQLSGEVEGLWLPSKNFRIGLSAGGLWVHDALGGARGLLILEGAVPQWWGEWFFGLAGGAAYLNVAGPWQVSGVGRARFGADLVILRPVCMGVAISYSLMAPGIVHTASIDLRLGVAF